MVTPVVGPEILWPIGYAKGVRAGYDLGTLFEPSEDPLMQLTGTT